jgi:hypothetical protein
VLRNVVLALLETKLSLCLVDAPPDDVSVNNVDVSSLVCLPSLINYKMILFLFPSCITVVCLSLFPLMLSL